VKPGLLIRAEALQRLDMPWWGAATLWARDPELARMTELIELGDHRIAKRISACGQLVETKKQRKVIAAPCNRRECLRCVAQRIYPKYRRQIAQGAREMRNPISVRFSVASHGEHDLEAAINLLRTSLQKLRRLVSMRDATKGVGLIHPAHARNERWHPHVHLLIDAPERFDLARVEKDWERLTSGWGHVELRPRTTPSDEGAQAGDPEDLERAANYIAHSADWAPENGALPLPQYAQLRQAIEGRQLLVSWGLTGRGRRRGSEPVRRPGTDPNTAYRRSATALQRRHTVLEAVEWDEVEKEDDVLVESRFRLREGGENSQSVLVRAMSRIGRRREVIEHACVSFLSLGLTIRNAGRDRLMHTLAFWLDQDFEVGLRPRRPEGRPTDVFAVRLSDGPPKARGDTSPHEFLFLALGHAKVLADLDSAEDALELIALVFLAESLRGADRDDMRRPLVLAAMRRLLGMVPSDDDSPSPAPS
jgi:hypothetical protein